ncbi:MAG: T9SS type A sorting domain-containing protein [Bacteroidota bacterium]
MKRFFLYILLALFIALPGVANAQYSYDWYYPREPRLNDHMNNAPFLNNEPIYKISGNGMPVTNASQLPDSGITEYLHESNNWIKVFRSAYSYNADSTIGSTLSASLYDLVVSGFTKVYHNYNAVKFSNSDLFLTGTNGIDFSLGYNNNDTSSFDNDGNFLFYGSVGSGHWIFASSVLKYYRNSSGRLDSVNDISGFAPRGETMNWYSYDNNGRPDKITTCILESGRRGSYWKPCGITNYHGWHEWNGRSYHFPLAKPDSSTTKQIDLNTNDTTLLSAIKCTYAPDGKATKINYNYVNGRMQPVNRITTKYDNFINTIFYRYDTLAPDGSLIGFSQFETWITTDSLGRPHQRFIANKVNSSEGLKRITYKYVSNTAGTAPQLAAAPFQAYPNPFNTSLNISLPAGETSAHFTLTDLSGRILKQGMINAVNSRTQIDTQELKAGVYLLSVQQAGGALKTIKVYKAG